MGTYLIGNVKGPKGEDGVSPSARVQQLSNGAIITITDATGTTSARIRDGVDADGNNIDLTVYPTKVEVNGQIAGLANTYATKTELTNRINAIDIPVSSVNGMTGAVVIPETDLTGYATQSWINQQGFITQAPVASVNGKTGNVSLSATDVGALPDNTEIPTDTSDLTNSANFVDQSTLNTYLAAKQDELTAGAGIDITNNVVSAKQKLIVADATNFTAEEREKFDNQTPTNEIYDVATKTIYYYAGREHLVVGEKLYYSPLLDFVNNGVSKDTDIYYIQLSGSGSFTTSGLVAANASSSAFSGNYNDLTNKPDLSIYAETADLATVATTGDYTDLTNTPTIPTAVSDLTNDSGFITSSDLPTLATVATSGSYNDLTNKPTIPTVPTTVSSFTNDAGYLTSSDLPADELPSYSSSDDGKVLSVDSNGDLEWTTPAAGSNYGDADVADYISDTFGMGVSGAGPTLWGQTEDPMYLNEDSQAEVILEGADASNPFVVNTGYHIEFELLTNADDSVVETVNETFTATSVNNDDELDQAFNTFANSNNTISFNIDYWGDAWWLEMATFTGYVGSGWHISNFKIYLPTSGTVKTPLNADFIPNTIARVSDIPADELPADPVNDGTYFLTNTISSGSATKAWTTIPAAAGNSF